jgi:hypothetical protein
MTDNASTGELVSKLSQEVSELIRDELRLAQVEVSGKAKKAGVGVGLLGTAGIIALSGVAVLIATAILALALVLDAWLAALIVGIVLMAIAGVAGLLGKNRVAEAAPPVPSDAIESVKKDVAAVKEGAHR